MPKTVILAKAGILPIMGKIPACAGMTTPLSTRKFETASKLLYIKGKVHF